MIVSYVQAMYCSFEAMKSPHPFSGLSAQPEPFTYDTDN
jgi:hypothetical protein